MLVEGAVSWLSLDYTHTRLQRWDVTDEDLICWGFPLSSSFHLSSTYFLQTFHTETLLHIRSLLRQCVACVCAGCVHTSGRQNLQDMRDKVCLWSLTGPGTSASSHVTIVLQTHTVWLFVFLYVLSCCSRWAQTGKIKHCCTLWVWTEAAIANSELPVRDCDGCSGLWYCSRPLFSVIHILKGNIWCQLWSKTSCFYDFHSVHQYFNILYYMLWFPVSMMRSHASSFSFLSFCLSHLSLYWLLYFSLFHPLCLPPSSFLVILGMRE